MNVVVHLVANSTRNPWLTDVVGAMRARRDFAPMIITLASAGQLHSDMQTLGVDAASLDGASFRDPRVIPRLVRILRGTVPTIMHTHILEPAIAYAFARQLVRPRSVWVSTRHQVPRFIDLAPVPAWKRMRFRAVDAVIHRHMDAVITISRRSFREVRQLGVGEDRVVEIPLGFDLHRLRPDPRSVEKARRDLTTGDGPVAVCVARLSWEKNLAFLLRSWTEVLGVIPNARLAIVGAGPLEGELRSQADGLGLASNVAFLGFRPDALQLIGAADIVVQPSLSENMSMVGIEALLQSRPLVATPVGIVGEHILDGVHCLVAPPDNTATFAAKVLAILRDPPLGERLGRAGQRLVVERFAVDRMEEQYEALYARLIRARDQVRAT